MYPADRRYSKEHEWLLVQDGTARIGITAFAQNELGDIVFVELPQPGLQFKAGDVLGTIESVKAVSEIFAPVGGTVREANSALEATPELVNSDPHGAGWYCRIELADPAELDGLLDGPAYEELVSK